MRAGIARSTLQRIEKGDPAVGIGLAFEAATLTGVHIRGGERGQEADLDDAVRRASLGAFVESLPDGLETRVGERGVRLSGYVRFSGRCPYCGTAPCKSKIQLQIIMMV